MTVTDEPGTRSRTWLACTLTGWSRTKSIVLSGARTGAWRKEWTGHRGNRSAWSRRVLVKAGVDEAGVGANTMRVVDVNDAGVAPGRRKTREKPISGGQQAHTRMRTRIARGLDERGEGEPAATVRGSKWGPSDRPLPSRQPISAAAGNPGEASHLICPSLQVQG